MIVGESQNVEFLKSAYAAFNRGDIPSLLGMFALDASWDWPAVNEVPQAGSRHGRDEIAQFFETLLKVEEPLDFQQEEFIAQGDRVVVLGTYRARARSTGRTWDSRYAHVWTIRGGQIGAFDIHYNTAAAVDAYRT